MFAADYDQLSSLGEQMCRTAGRIADVGARPPAGASVTDLGEVALIPGLIYAHTHLEFSDLSRPLGTPGMSLVEWIRLVIARRSHPSVDLQHSIAAGMRESLGHGVTTVCDIATAGLEVYRGGTHGPDIVALLEVIGFSRARAASAEAAVNVRLQPCRAAEIAGRLTVGLSPHAPYTVNPDLLRELVRIATRDRMTVAMHLAESREELDLLDAGRGPFRELLEERSMWDDQAVLRGARPLDYLRSLAAAPRSLVIHGTHLAKDDLDFMAAHRERMTLVWCPRTHAWFNRDRYPLAAALNAGVRVALGTDSRASSPDLSLLAEVRHAAREHPRAGSSQILQMATLRAAEALGIAEDAGSITPGKLANLTAVPMDAAGYASPTDAIAYGNGKPIATWRRGVKVNGQ